MWFQKFIVTLCFTLFSASTAFAAVDYKIENQPSVLEKAKHYKSKKGIGAHIRVMYENEQIENEIWQSNELVV